MSTAKTVEEKYKGIDIDHKRLHRVMKRKMRLHLTDPIFDLTEFERRRFRRVPLHIKDGDGSFTDFKRIVIGKKAQNIAVGDINERFWRALTVMAHEVSHILFTNSDKWMNYLNKQEKEKGKLVMVVKDIANIIEDFRIERKFGLAFPEYKKLFFLVRYEDTKKGLEHTKEELKKSTKLDASKKLTAIRNTMLYMGAFQVVPDLSDESEEIQSYLNKIFPYQMYGKNGKTTDDMIQATDKVVEILKPLFEEASKSASFEFESLLSELLRRGSKEVGGKGMDEEDEMDKEEMSDEMKEMIEKVEKEIEELKGLEEEEDEGGSLEIDLDEDEVDSSGESGDGSMDPKSESKGEEPKREDEVEEKKGTGPADFDHLVKEFVFSGDGPEGKSGDMDKMIDEYKKQARTSIDRDFMEDVFKEDFRSEPKESGKGKIEEKKIADIEAVLPNPHLHKGVRDLFLTDDDMEKFTIAEYEEILKPLKGIINSAARKVSQVNQKGLEYIEQNQKSGKIDKQSYFKIAALNEINVFSKQFIDERSLDLEGMLLVDNSGSNNSSIATTNSSGEEITFPRYKMNQIAAITFHEIFRKLKFPHSVWGFDESFAERSVQRFSPMVHYKNSDNINSGLRLKDIQARGNNRDGYSIMKAAEYFKRSSTAMNKIMIVLSDGQPAASGYGGVDAVRDVHDTVEAVEKMGITVIGVFTGDKKENQVFEQMYKKAIYCNNDSIAELPDRIKDLLIEEFKNKIDEIA